MQGLFIRSSQSRSANANAAGCRVVDCSGGINNKEGELAPTPVKECRPPSSLHTRKIVIKKETGKAQSVVARGFQWLALIARQVSGVGRACSDGVLVLFVGLFLETTYALEVKGDEAVVLVLLVWRQLLVLHGLETDAVLADADDDDASRLLAALVVYFLGESYANLWNGTVRRARFVHEFLLFIVDVYRAAVVARVGRGRGQSKAAVVVRYLGIGIVLVVHGQLRLLFGVARAAEHEESNDGQEGDEDQDQESDEELDHGGREGKVAVTADQSRGVGHGETSGGGLVLLVDASVRGPKQMRGGEDKR